MSLQADGRVILGGYWEDRNPFGIARLRSDGSAEPFADFAANILPIGQVNSVASTADGKILIGGVFSRVNDQPRNHLARLHNDPATQSLTITSDASAVQWLRGGSAPEVSLVTFERSVDAGQSWTMLGRGTRITGGWQITGQTMPVDAAIRARGRTGDGRSTGLVEQVINVPEIAVEQPAGTDLTDGSPGALVDYGITAGSKTLTITLRNPGTVPVLNLSASIPPGGNAGDFAITQPPPATLAAGATAEFAVTFTPGGGGTRTATLQVASNDPDENPFDIALTGRQATASEAWRMQYFGSPENNGPGADLADPDGDGQVNLIEFATQGHPLEFTAPPGVLVKNGAVLEYTYTRPTAAVAELNYQPQASITLSGTWTTIGITSEVLNDDGVTQTVKVTAPAGTGKRFVRLRVTRL